MQRERPFKQRGVPGPLSRRLLPSPVDILLISTYIWSLSLPVFTEHAWWRLRAGAWTIEHFDVPHENLFSFTAAHYPWINHEWLSDAFLFLTLDRLGPGWLLFFRGAILATILALLYRLMRKRGGVVPSFVLTSGVAAALLQHQELGPMPLVWLFASLLITLLEDPAWRQGRTFVLVPLLFLMWANTHGSFLIGLVLMVAHSVGGRMDHRRNQGNGHHNGHLVAAAMAVPLTLCNPYYWSLYSLGLEELALLIESIPLRLRLLPWPFVTLVGVLTLGTWLVVALAGRRIRWRLVLPLILLTPLAWIVPSYLPFWALWASVTLMEHFEQLAERIQHDRSGYLEEMGGISKATRRLAHPFAALSRFDRYLAHGNYTAMTIALALAYFSIPPGETLTVAGIEVQGLTMDELVPEEMFPRGAVRALAGASRRERHVMAPTAWGSYLLWEGYPDLKPFLDGREAAFPLDVVEDYDLFESAGTGWEEILERYAVDYLLWRSDDFQVRALTAAGLWVPLYQDAMTTVLGRKYPVPPSPTPPSVDVDVPAEDLPPSRGAVPPPTPTPRPVFGMFRPNRSGPRD